MKEYVINDNQSNKRLDKFLMTLLPKAPSSFIYKMLRKKNIKLNGSRAEGNEKLNVGDTVNIYLSDETFDSFADDVEKKENEYFEAYKKIKGVRVVYEDKDILIMDKPGNVLSQKAKPGDLSLNEWMIGYLLSKNIISLDDLKTFKPSVLNRIDRNTKGLVIGAKSLKGSQTVSLMLKDRSLKKYYKATVHGIVTEERYLEGYIIKDPVTNIVTVYNEKPTAFKDNEKPQLIKTYYKPIDSFDNKTILEIELITGKSHQIRAHLASVGYPVVGDMKYGTADRRIVHGNGQDLVAYKLIFPEKCDIDSLNGRVVEI